MLEITLQSSQANTSAQPRFLYKVSKRNEKRLFSAIKSTLRKNAQGYFSSPPDPTLIRKCIQEFGEENVTFGDNLMIYLGVMVEQQTQVLNSIYNKTPVHPDLLPFQNSTVHFMDAVGKGIIAHETGAGKTPPACVALDHCGCRKVLIICLNTLKWNWYEELTIWSTMRNTYIIDGKATKRDQFLYPMIGGKTEEQLEKIRQIALSKDNFVFIMNYTNFRLMGEDLIKLGFDAVIADESHRLINRKAQQTQLFHKLAKGPAKVWMLTGTPIRNNYDDVFSLLKACDAHRFSSYWSFAYLYFNVNQTPFGTQEIVGIQDKELFNSMLSTYMYREMKKDVRPELPDKLYQVIKIPLFGDQRRAYDKLEEELILTIERATKEGTTFEKVLEIDNALSLQLRLRQMALSPELIGGGTKSAKMDALLEMVPNFTEQGKKVLVFSMFREFINLLSKRMKNLNINHGMLVGGMNIKAIKEVERQLNEGEIDVIIGTTQAMGEGKNLQKANVVIFTDRSWVPAENLQAEDRVHRGDITESPEIYSLIHPGSVDEDIIKVNERKQDIAQGTVGEVEVLRELLRRKKGEKA